MAKFGQGAVRIGHECHLIVIALGVQRRGGDAAHLGANSRRYELTLAGRGQRLRDGRVSEGIDDLVPVDAAGVGAAGKICWREGSSVPFCPSSSLAVKILPFLLAGREDSALPPRWP